MTKSSAAISLLLIGSATAMIGYNAFQATSSDTNQTSDLLPPDTDFADGFPDTQPTTGPSASGVTNPHHTSGAGSRNYPYSGSHYWHGSGSSGWAGGSSNSGSHSSSSSAGQGSHTSRGGFGSSGHAAGA